MISIIVAQANKQVIGKEGDQPFYLPNDLKRFKELTTGHKVIMGRKTHDAIRNRLGSALPNRTNIVISRTLPDQPDVVVVRSLADAIRETNSNEESFIIGGAQIYRQAMGIADRIYLTKVDADIEGDTFFPKLDDEDGWQIVSIEKNAADDRHPYPYRYINLQRGNV